MDTVENVETAKKIIEVSVRDRVATHIGDDFYVCGNTEYEIHFDFDEEWDALDIKTARFIADGNVLYPDRIFSGNVCSFPDNPPISNTTSVRVGVFAGNLHTTTPARIPAAKSILCGTPTPAAPEEDAYHEAMEKMAKVATEARTQAAASAQSAQASAQSAVEADASAKAAAASEATVERYSANADTQAQAAAKSASDAAASAAEAVAARDKAIAQADDAEQSAKDAAVYAQNAQAYQEGALAASDDAAASAQAAKASASESAASASAAAASAADAAESVQDVFIVKVGTDKLCSHTKQEIVGAASSGKVCLMVYYNGEVLKYKGLTTYGDETTCPYFVGSLYKSTSGDAWYAAKVTVLSDNKTAFDGSPIRIANPNSLRFTGAVEATYNGSEYVTVNIPEGGGAGLPETADPLKQLVTDETGNVGWEERLAYKQTAQVENLASTELTFLSDDDGYALTTPWAADVVAGAMCAVNYNGTEYACEAVAYEELFPDSDIPEGMCVLGNVAVMGFEGVEGANADAPFALITVSTALAPEMGVYAIFLPLDGATSVTLAVSSVVTTYKTIEKRYIPGDLLPSVTTDNEGQFLRVAGGKWSAAAIDNAEGVGF